jgi:diamine N-acetyltransferase
MNQIDIEQPILSIVGERVALGPLRRDLLPLILRWSNDFEVLRTINPVRPVTIEALDAAFVQAISNPNEVHFIVYEHATMRPIGEAYLVNVTGNTAELGLSIGEKDTWAKGYGTEAARLLLDYGFNALGLHNIMATMYNFNEASVRGALRAGFREIGRRREVISRGGRLHDMVYMDCLATEFESPIVKHVMLGQ